MTGALRLVTEKSWLLEHPYLEPIAEFHAIVASAASKCLNTFCTVPNWNDCLDDFHAGVPLLRSSKSIIDLQPLEATVPKLVEKLASIRLPSKLEGEIHGVARELAEIPTGSIPILTCLLDQEVPTISHWGLLRYVGWTAVTKYLSRLIGAFDSWRDEERWLRNYCPLCGSRPAMAQLVDVDPGRMRFLSCGCCGTRWRFRRIECPFCEDQDHRRLATLTIKGEEGLRIDYCDSCKGYLKTYYGAGSEAVLLSDWTSLHLDVLAQDRGLKRLAASLYEL